MSKIAVHDNVRVECQIEWPPYQKDQARAFQEAKREAEELATQIRRHVDSCGRRQFSEPGIEWDTHYECSLCGREWEEDLGEPLCCEAAAAEWRAQKEAPDASA